MKYFLAVLILSGLSFGQGNNNNNFGGGTSSSSTSSGSSVISTGLMAEYKMTECSGTTITDSSGNGNNGTFGAQAPTWVGGAGCTTGGLQFTGSSSQFATLPAALNTARTVYLVTNFTPKPTDTVFMSPISGNAANTWGAVFVNVSNFGFSNYPFSGGGQYLIGTWANGGSPKYTSMQGAGGLNVIALTLGSAGDSTKDQVWVNNNTAPFQAVQPALYANNSFNGVGQTSGLITGNLQLGGSASGALFSSFVSWYTGQMFYASIYSTYHTPSQISQNMQAILSQMAQRGFQPGHFNAQTGLNNQFVGVGDSITFGTGLSTTYLQYMTLASPNLLSWSWVDAGLPSITALQQNTEAAASLTDSWFVSGGGNNVAAYWLGTNDCAGGQTGAQAYANLQSAIRRHRSHYSGQGYKTIVISMVSRTGQDTCKNALNTPLRQTWQTIADGFADIAADANMGADGAFSNTTFIQVDGIHPTTHAQANDIAPVVQRAVRRIFGNNSWTSANTYTTTAPAATTLTAASESTNTMTFTMASNPFVAGQQVTVAGVTPAGYNGTWNVLTATGTTFTAFNNTTGLGAGSVFGTAAAPVQKDEDVYTILGGSATSPSFTLETCVGYTGQNLYLKNANTTSPWVLTPVTGETIDGAATLTMPTASSGNNPVVVLQSQLTSATAGGCTWKRLQ